MVSKWAIGHLGYEMMFSCLRLVDLIVSDIFVVDWEKELSKDLTDYEVVGGDDDAAALERELMEEMSKSTDLK